MSMNRSTSFISALKWWPLQHHNSHNSQNANATSGVSTIDCCSGKSTDTDVTSSSNGNGVRDTISFAIRSNKAATRMFGSSVAVQKLRESKWFKSNEQCIFCAVIECGFIVEMRGSPCSATNKNKLVKQQQSKQLRQDLINKTHLNDNINITTNLNNVYNEIMQPQQRKPPFTTCQQNPERYNKVIIANDTNIFKSEEASANSDTDAMDNFNRDNENRTPITSWFGVTLCRTSKDNKTKPETVEIYSLKIRDNGTFRMLKLSLADIWKNGWELRINNFADKEKQAHNEKDIRNQISFARKAKHSLWHNSKHFAYWCRYGNRQQDVRKRQMSECMKWGTVGMNAGIILLMNNNKSHPASK